MHTHHGSLTSVLTWKRYSLRVCSTTCLLRSPESVCVEREPLQLGQSSACIAKHLLCGDAVLVCIPGHDAQLRDAR